MNPINSTTMGSTAVWPDFLLSESINQLSEDEAIQDFLNLPSDMESFMELDNIQEVTEKEAVSSVLPDLLQEIGIDQLQNEQVMDCSLESNQTLIDEVESYLRTVSGEPTSLEEEKLCSLEESWNLANLCQETTASWNPANHEETKPSSIDPDKILEALATGNVVEDAESPLTESDLKDAFTTSVVGHNGENVIIIIAPPSTSTAGTVSPSASARSTVNPDPIMLSPRSSAGSPMYSAGSPGSSVYSAGSPGPSDYEWTPSPNVESKPRKKYQRKVRPTPPVGPYPKEKFERKKAQNRTAAFKYREKKKAEQDAQDDELVRLCDRNVLLKKRLSDIEIEVKCLKKLMAETGLGMYLN